MTTVGKMVSEKRDLSNKIESLINDFQGKHRVDLIVNINESSAQLLGNDYKYKECAIKIEL